MRLRLAELVAAWSLATDLGLGLSQEHVLRQCQIALGLSERLGLDEADRAAVYYVAMLAWVGCTADSHELAHQFGDDLALRADAHRVDLAGLPMVGFLLRRVGTGRPPLRRAGMAAALVASGGRGAAEAMTAHCQVAAAIARRLGLGPEVREPLLHVFSRWDGRGIPAGTGGEELPLAIRLVHRRDRRGPPPRYGLSVLVPYGHEPYCRRRSRSGAEAALSRGILRRSAFDPGGSHEDDWHRAHGCRRCVGRGTDTFVDNRRKGEGVGDSFITTRAKLSDPSTRSKVGSMDILGTIASRSSNFAAITARLRGGTVQANGVMRHDRTPTVLAVTGGTGDFENARGTFTPNERTQRATFKLLP